MFGIKRDAMSFSRAARDTSRCASTSVDFFSFRVPSRRNVGNSKAGKDKGAPGFPVACELLLSGKSASPCRKPATLGSVFYTVQLIPPQTTFPAERWIFHDESAQFMATNRLPEQCEAQNFHHRLQPVTDSHTARTHAHTRTGTQCAKFPNVSERSTCAGNLPICLLLILLPVFPIQ